MTWIGVVGNLKKPFWRSESGNNDIRLTGECRFLKLVGNLCLQQIIKLNHSSFTCFNIIVVSNDSWYFFSFTFIYYRSYGMPDANNVFIYPHR